jgi:hypothetical protein
LSGKLTSTAALFFDALSAPKKLGIINLIPEHDEGEDRKFACPRHRYFRQAHDTLTPAGKSSWLLISFGGRLSGPNR